MEETNKHFFNSLLYLQNFNYKENENNFIQYNIYGSWWSKFKKNKINLSYKKFLKICFALRIFPGYPFYNGNKSCGNLNFSNFIIDNNSLIRIIKLSKLTLKKYFLKSRLTKIDFLKNILDTEIKISPRTLKRIFDNENYLNFNLKTFVIIMETLEVDYYDFFYQILKEFENETNN